jgi:predicted nucleic acid-binding protein
MYALDASALLVYLEKQRGYQKVKEAFTQAAEKGVNLLMSVVNWGEVYYILIRDFGINESEKIMNLIDSFPIDVISPDKELTQTAALYKATKKLPYADSFAAALAKHRKIDLLTADREFQSVQHDIKIIWL